MCVMTRRTPPTDVPARGCCLPTSPPGGATYRRPRQGALPTDVPARGRCVAEEEPHFVPLTAESLQDVEHPLVVCDRAFWNRDGRTALSSRQATHALGVREIVTGHGFSFRAPAETEISPNSRTRAPCPARMESRPRDGVWAGCTELVPPQPHGLLSGHLPLGPRGPQVSLVCHTGWRPMSPLTPMVPGFSKEIHQKS